MKARYRVNRALVFKTQLGVTEKLYHSNVIDFELIPQNLKKAHESNIVLYNMENINN